MLARVCQAAEIPIDLTETAPANTQLRAPRLRAKFTDPRIDEFTAVVLMLHDRFKEAPLLEWMIGLDQPFYLGVLGSARTQRGRIERLREAGYPDERLARLRGPIGLFGPSREAAPLAISVLAEIMQARFDLDGAA
jgi:xanthine dehydrogenase accessory factor